MIVLEYYLLDLNWCRAITQCTHPVNVLTTKLEIKIVRKLIRGGAWHSYSCGQTVGWMKMPIGKEVGLVPSHIVLDGDSAPTAAPPHFRPMPTVAKRSPISATAELLFTKLMKK